MDFVVIYDDGDQVEIVHRFSEDVLKTISHQDIAENPDIIRQTLGANNWLEVDA